jgi:hypothetical protein
LQAKSGFLGLPQAPNHHINGAFPAETIPYSNSGARLRISPKNAPIRCLPGILA